MEANCQVDSFRLLSFGLWQVIKVYCKAILVHNSQASWKNGNRKILQSILSQEQIFICAAKLFSACFSLAASNSLIAFYSFPSLLPSASATSQFLLPHVLCLLSFLWIFFVFCPIIQTVVFSVCLIFGIPNRESLSNLFSQSVALCQVEFSWQATSRLAAKLRADRLDSQMPIFIQ